MINAELVCILMYQGRIKVKYASVIINERRLEIKYVKNYDGDRVLVLGYHG